MNTYPQLNDRQWLASRYVDRGMTQQQIAKELGCTYQAVGGALRRRGIPTRPRGSEVGARRHAVGAELRLQREHDRGRSNRQVLSARAAVVAHAGDERPEPDLRDALIALASAALEWRCALPTRLRPRESAMVRQLLATRLELVARAPDDQVLRCALGDLAGVALDWAEKLDRGDDRELAA